MELKLDSFSFVLIVWGVALLGVTTEANPSNFQSVPKRCPEGVQFFPNPDYCTKYYQCDHGVPLPRECPKGLVFHESLSVCVGAGSEHDTCTPAHPDRECKRHTVDLIPHPLRCQGYYNCSDYVPYGKGQHPWSNGYEKECEFPQLFDIIRKKCVTYTQIHCGPGRKEEKWQCNYNAYMCPVAHCRPCYVDYPSCEGKPNGLWPIPYDLWSPNYIECKDQRDFKGRLQCPDGSLFNPSKQRCVSGMEGQFMMELESGQL